MEFMLDSANPEAIARCVEAFPIAGVTGNPSIFKNMDIDADRSIENL